DPAAARPRRGLLHLPRLPHHPDGGDRLRLLLEDGLGDQAAAVQRPRRHGPDRLPRHLPGRAQLVARDRRRAPAQQARAAHAGGARGGARPRDARSPRGVAQAPRDGDAGRARRRRRREPRPPARLARRGRHDRRLRRLPVPVLPAGRVGDPRPAEGARRGPGPLRLPPLPDRRRPRGGARRRAVRRVRRRAGTLLGDARRDLPLPPPAVPGVTARRRAHDRPRHGGAGPRARGPALRRAGRRGLRHGRAQRRRRHADAVRQRHPPRREDGQGDPAHRGRDRGRSGV
ncbi:MAG: hypothetical protein AVDCRST_MAG30-957, partial [uncultured Solirubrobacteraceae bacterium]